MELLDMLHLPSREFTPIPFWFLNDDLTDEGIREQLTDFAAHGVYGVVLHPRMGLPRRIGYLSETFFHYICMAVQAAAELDMKVVLYDDGMYPSGSAGGQVVVGHPEFKLHEQLILPIEAEEMVELTVNGIEAGVSFWSPHDFDVTDLVHEGENEIRLTVTGSLANRYGRPVWYGVKGDWYDR